MPACIGIIFPLYGNASSKHCKSKKRIELDIRLSKLYWLLGRKSKLSVFNKLLVYNQVLKPVWTYAIQLWGCTCQSNLNIIQRFQNKFLRTIMNWLYLLNYQYFGEKNDILRSLRSKLIFA